MVFVDVSRGLSFVLRVIRNLKIMRSKAVECLQSLRGSRGAEVVLLKREGKRENSRDG